MEKWSILAVDDDIKILEILRQYLEEDGHSVHTCTDGACVMDALETKKPDVILLDLVLPDTDGLSLMHRIREKTSVPIIVVSGKGDTMDRVVGLELGADDYVTKPFHLREIAARIKTVMRRKAPVQKENNDQRPSESGNNQPVPDKDDAAHLYIFDGWTLDCGKLELCDPDKKSVPLTTGEFVMLRTLLQRPQRALSRDFLFERTRDHDFESYDRAVDIQMTRLRKKLRDDPRAPRFIKTVRGIGYMFIADVKKG